MRSEHDGVVISSYDLSALALCAVRYAMPRMTYVPSTVREIVRKHIRQIDNDTLDIIVRDIGAEKNSSNRYALGHPSIDEGRWLDFQKELQDESLRREGLLRVN